VHPLLAIAVRPATRRRRPIMTLKMPAGLSSHLSHNQLYCCNASVLVCVWDPWHVIPGILWVKWS